jgi:2'-5' RNA ligase
MIRLFSCIWVPDNLIEEIEVLLSKLKATGIKAKFVEKENLHVTVNFLGDVNENKLDEVKMKMGVCLKNLREFHVKLEGLKLIPNENHIRVLGVKAKSSDLGNLIICLWKLPPSRFPKHIIKLPKSLLFALTPSTLM